MPILPGSLLSLPKNAMCDTEGHVTTPAVKNVVGECDSMGHESILMCQACYDKYRAEVAASATEEQHCDWCNAMKTDVKPYRDFEEGSYGPVYSVCRDCRVKHAKYIDENYA